MNSPSQAESSNGSRPLLSGRIVPVGDVGTALPANTQKFAGHRAAQAVGVRHVVRPCPTCGGSAIQTVLASRSL